MPCKKCGCKLSPCRCAFDNEADFFKYGESFLEINFPLNKENMTKIDKDWISREVLLPRKYLGVLFTSDDLKAVKTIAILIEREFTHEEAALFGKLDSWQIHKVLEELYAEFILMYPEDDLIRSQLKVWPYTDKA